jgi:hypothetical protein
MVSTERKEEGVTSRACRTNKQRAVVEVQMWVRKRWSRVGREREEGSMLE